ncbi:BglII/BstYI family type II restriction endonuclease [Azospirillum doebereinerae]|uniref:Restriction endonuclease n=1 Tax=Azospirillum doebereinerae TaxID=92933 RepID=A0A3S0V2M8_9PROT|nr:BglII/BstYI family type II restriction endonuclease [Azospirillum doebereinerae]MCG5239595.1 hypothetical protein [Azospirillum doebereinerae]RUQ74165.1 hypothetical protein EJ913_07345 [Azospirillum doebereinerae]
MSLLSCLHDTAPIIEAKDADLGDLFPPGFLDLYEVHSYRNAARILAYACTPEFQEIVARLMEFRIRTEDIVASGGNKSQIAKSMELMLNPLGWHETRIRGDLFITKEIITHGEKRLVSGKNRGRTVVEHRQRDEIYKVKGFIDGHKIDFVKGRVSFDLEWNSKDQTFDRDLYAARTFYECGIIGAGVLLTRSAELAPLFTEVARRVEMKNFQNKYGASTTWMKKLLYRLDAGRGGGCPILALGIRPALVSDFDDWKAKHPVIRQQAVFELDDTGEDEDDLG